jgi:hypothetical protein
MRIKSACLVLLAVLVPASPAWTKPAAKPAARSAEPAVDPAAVKRLEEMGAFLRAQRAFTVRADTATDEVLDTGQKIQIAAKAELHVQRPNKMRVDLISDRKSRRLYYDGKTLTVYGPRTGYYATVKAPDSLRELVDFANDEYGIETPLADLFVWGTERAPTKQLTSAIYLGQSRIDGVETDHYAFRQQGVDWQVWIERGRRPLPRKLVLTTTDDDRYPQHAVSMTWDLTPPRDDRRFTFKPPPGSARIAIEHRGARDSG